MRILHWFQMFGNTIGGIEVAVSKLLSACRDRGHELCLVTSHLRTPLPDEDRFEGIPLHRFHFHEALEERDHERVFAILREIAELKRSFEPDLVHFHFAGVSVNAYYHLHTRSASPAPTVITLHGLVPDLPDRAPLNSRLLASGEWVTAVSEALLEQARDFVPEITPRSSVIYNGLEPPSRPTTPPEFSPPTVLCLGRLTREKGFDLAVGAFAGILAQHPGGRLVLIGDGPEKPALRNHARTLGVEESVEFRGWVAPERVPSLIDEASLVLVPSRYEAFGLTALEAALRARPVVASRVGGLPEVVIEDETGLLVEPEDESALARGVLSLLDDPARARRLGRAARERASSVFGLDRCVDAYTKLYGRLRRA